MSGPLERTLRAVPDRPVTSYRADELMAMEFPPPKWAVHGLIAEGLTVLAGPPKVGKSWLSLGLGLAIAAGKPALGSIPTESGSVLYLALEDTPRRLKSRMGKMLAHHTAPHDLTLDTYCPPITEGGIAYIGGWIDENPDARLIVIDVFTKIRGRPPVGTSSAYEADYAAIGALKRIADTYAVAVVVVHHVRKAAAEDFLATVSGTNGIAGAADAILVLERPRAKADGVLHVTGRDVEETDYALAFDPTTGAWTLLEGSLEQHLLQDTRALIARHIRDYPGSTPAVIAQALDLERDNVKQTCRRMADAGQLTARAGGAYYPPVTGDSTGDTARPNLLSPLSPLSPFGLDQHKQDEGAVTAPVTPR